MYIQIAGDGSLSLEDCDNMKAFSIVEPVDASATGKAVTALSAIAEPAEENHYWIDAEAVVQLSSQGGNPQWLENFWNMLKQVEAYGYSDVENKRIKAHVESK
jgi:hypothetical protein